MTRFLIFALAATLLQATGAPACRAAEEMILEFDSRVEIRPDGTQTVDETIRVVSAMNKIRRGIYRDFPLRSAASGNAPFNVVAVSIDGMETSDYKVERSIGNARVIIGNPSRSLGAGEHTFVISYETAGHVQFFDDHAELGWNVTGDGWDFTIKNASCTITLPEGGKFDEMAGWLGRAGTRESPIDFSFPEPGVAVFVAQKRIEKGEHFTVAVRFPRELVSDYSRDNALRQTVIVLLVLFYFLITWFIWGRDPKPGTVIPLFYSPKAGYYGTAWDNKRNVRDVMSAAATSYVKNAAFLDNRGFSSLFVGLATKGACTITKNGDAFTISPIKLDAEAVAELPEEERSVYHTLLTNADASGNFILSDSKAANIRTMHDDVVKILGKRYAPLWAQNIWIQAIGWLVVLPAGFLALNNADGSLLSVLLGPALLAGIIFLVRKQIAYFWSRSINSPPPAVVILRILPLVVWFVVGFRVLSLATSVFGMLLYQIHSLTLSSIALVAIAMIFGPFMKAPSITGRKLLDRIDGLLMYISVAEKDRLKALNPPKYTPETFDRILPYAVAFGLEETWCARFAQALAGSAFDNRDDGAKTRYRMFRNGQRNSFTRSVSRAAIPPPAKSGGSSGSGGSFFGGGGGAGRGGGGGGGGGW